MSQSPAQLLAAVLAAAPNPSPLMAPDGRRLVRYDLSDAHFTAVLNVLTPAALADVESLLPRTNRPDDAAIPAIFVLGAAESWRRFYDGGPWTWDVIPFTSTLSPADRSNLVRAGLARLKRPVFSSQRNEFLGTIAAEAGIPSGVVKRDGARLRAYLRTLLQDFASFQSSPRFDLAWARRHTLPMRLQQTGFIELASDIAAHALKLGQSLAALHISPPISLRTLNNNLPGWRSTFPVRLEDGAAVALVAGLVDAAAQPPRESSFRLRTELHSTATHITVSHTLDIPARVSLAQLQQSFRIAAPVPARVDLLVETSRGPRLLAELIARGDTWHTEATSELTLARTSPIPIDFASDGIWHIRDAAFTQSLFPPRVFMRGAGFLIGDLAIDDATDMSETPIAFTRRITPDVVAASQTFGTVPDASWRLTGAAGGSIARDRDALILAPPRVSRIGATPSRLPTLLAFPPEVESVVLVASGDTDATTSCHFDRFEFQRSGTDSTARFSPIGRTLDQHAGEAVYLGPPAMVVNRGTSIGTTTIPAHRLEYATPVGWRPLTSLRAPARVLVRYADRGLTHARLRLNVWPTSSATPVVLSAVEAGKCSLELELARTVNIGISTSGLSFTENVQAGSRRTIRIESAFTPTPSRISVVLDDTSAGTSLHLDLPFPRTEAGFAYSDGKRIGHGADVPIATTFSVVAEVCSASQCGADPIFLTATLTGQDVDPEIGRVDVAHLQPPQAGQSTTLSLVAIDRRLRRLLSMSTDQDAAIKLTLHTAASPTDKRPPSLTLTRYSGSVQWDKLTQSATIDLHATPIPRTPPEVDFRLEAVSPASPETHIRLTPQENGTYAPNVPLPSGHWIIIARDPATSQMPLRAALASIPGTPETPGTSSIEQAIALPRFKEREAAINAALHAMGDNPLDRSWPLVEAYLRSLDTLPPAFFETVRHLADVPKTLAIALYRSDNPTRVIQAFAELPFHWSAFPIAALSVGAHALPIWLTHMLSSAAIPPELLQALVGSEVAKRRHAVAAALTRHLPSLATPVAMANQLPPEAFNQPRPEDPLRLDPQSLMVLEDTLHETRLSHATQGPWPRLSGLANAWHDIRPPTDLGAIIETAPESDRGVLIAPLLAAIHCTYNIPASPLVAFELSVAESSAPMYFGKAHQLTLALLSSAT